MQEAFSKVMLFDENLAVKVSELPGEGTRIEGIIKGPDGWQQHGICFSHEAMKALIKILDEWEEEVL